MKWSSANATTLALFNLAAATAHACGPGGQATVRPLGSDHLLYTIERAAEQDAPGLTGRKFRLIVDESRATGLQIVPEKAFRVEEVSRYEGNVTFSAEIIDERALYKAESWGKLPRPLEFQVLCTPNGGPQQTAQNATVPEPKSPPARMITLTPDDLRKELAEASGSAVVEAYPQTRVESAPLPPVPKPPPEPEPEPPPAAEEPAPATASAAAPRQPAEIGKPDAALTASETARLEVQLRALREENLAKGRSKLSYELVVRNPLPKGVQCDVEVESSYPRSFASSDVVSIDMQTHEGVQIRSRGFRAGVMGEIEYLPNVLGGSRWMKQNRYDPGKGGLRLRNCVSLQG